MHNSVCGVCVCGGGEIMLWVSLWFHVGLCAQLSWVMCVTVLLKMDKPERRVSSSLWMPAGCFHRCVYKEPWSTTFFCSVPLNLSCSSFCTGTRYSGWLRLCPQALVNHVFGSRIHSILFPGVKSCAVSTRSFATLKQHSLLAYAWVFFLSRFLSSLMIKLVTTVRAI